jgi:hypothetical protein
MSSGMTGPPLAVKGSYEFTCGMTMYKGKLMVE